MSSVLTYQADRDNVPRTRDCHEGAPAGPPTRQPPMKGRAVTTRSDSSEEEWSRIVRAPFVAGLAISLADPSGPIEAAKESMATVKSATNPSSREQLVTEVALDLQAEVQQKRNPLKGYRPSLRDRPSGEQVLVERAPSRRLLRPGRPRGDGGVRPVASPRRKPPPTPPRRAVSWAGVSV